MKASKGVIIYGITAVIFFILMIQTFDKTFPRFSHFETIKSLGLKKLLQLISTLGFGIFGLGVIGLQKWARRGLIIVALYFIMDTFIPIKYVVGDFKSGEYGQLSLAFIGCLYFASIVWFFTKAKIKEQFNVR